MEVPRYYWNRIHKNDRYDILLCQIAQIHEDQEQVKFELEEHAEVAIGLEPHTPIQLRPYLQEIIYKVDIFKWVYIYIYIYKDSRGCSGEQLYAFNG